MSSEAESVVLCEGYYDRSFWAGWLTHLGCTDPGLPESSGPRKPVPDPRGRPVAKGHFAFLSPQNSFVRVVPCNGRDRILPELRRRLQQRATESVARLVVCVDPDAVISNEALHSARGLTLDDLKHTLDQWQVASREEAGELAIDEGATSISLVRWEVEGSCSPGVPAQQTLERLVCAALVAANPERGEAVAQWLQGRPSPPDDANGKAHAWSFMAGWYAQLGCDRFYRHIWEDQALVNQLRILLERAGVWRIAESLLTARPSG